MNQPVFIRDDEPLTWSPHAPAPTFFLDQAGWKMQGTLKIQYLRANTPDGPTRVVRDEQGRTYYMPSWPCLTSLVDAQTEAEVGAAAKGLARLDPTITAKELGFGAPLCFHILLKDAPAASGQRRKWEKEQVFVSYWAKLSRAQRTKASQAVYQDWTLLDLAVRRRQFRAAEQLWQDGCRFSPQALKQGMPAWALTEGLFEDIPSYAATVASWASKPAQDFLSTVIEDDGRPMDWTDSEAVPRAAFLSLTRRWLKRMAEEGVDFNASVTVEEAPDADGTKSSRVAHRTAFMHALYCPPEDFLITKAWTQAWTDEMTQAGYDFGLPVSDPFALRQAEPGSMPEYAQRVGIEGVQLDQITKATLESRLNQSGFIRTKTRL